MPDPQDWVRVARLADADDLREQILTGYRSGKPFSPYVPTIALPGPLDTVLDFGCGVGRNFPYLKTLARHVTGFDLPAMIERCRALAPEPAEALADDWHEVKARRFDLIVASLVLQHIEPAGCRAYLADFARMTPLVYVLTRARSDFDASVLGLVADAGLFEAGDCIEVDHDPRTHQLRVVGRMPFGAACAAERGHFEVLLSSRAAGSRGGPHRA